MTYRDAACSVAPAEVDVVAGLRNIVPFRSSQARIEGFKRSIFTHHSLFVICALKEKTAAFRVGCKPYDAFAASGGIGNSVLWQACVHGQPVRKAVAPCAGVAVEIA